MKTLSELTEDEMEDLRNLLSANIQKALSMSEVKIGEDESLMFYDILTEIADEV